MLQKSKMFALALAVGGAFAASGLTITVDNVQQRYPWNGIVDIDYTLEYGEGEAEPDVLKDRLAFVVTDNSVSPAVSYPVVHVNGCGPLPTSAGQHRVTWDATADGVTFNSASAEVKLEVRRYPEKYMVVDISAGASATAYDVSYLSAAPETDEGFNCEEYKGDKLVLRLVPPGAFVMGSPTTESNRNAGETQHNVTLTKPFYVGLFEITQTQYWNVVATDPSTYKGPYRPVEAQGAAYGVIRGNTGNWPANNDVTANSFFGRMRNRTGLTFDLPTEAQWEYACRAGTKGPFNDSDDATGTYDERLKLLGRYSGNKGKGLGGYTEHTTVGTYQPNGWGLYDMHGNVSEWCLDNSGGGASLGQLVDPVGPPTFGGSRAVRGGNQSSGAAACRSAAMATGYASGNSASQGCFGFRVTVTLDVDDCYTVVTSGVKSDFALDLSTVWNKLDVAPVAVAYSTLGWDFAESEDVGKTVSLVLTSTEEGATPETLQAELAGRGTWAWTPKGFLASVYRLEHLVSDSKGAAVPSETLTAQFSFVGNPKAVLPESTLREAVIASTSQAFALVNDENHPWGLVGAAGEGLSAPAGETATFSFNVVGAGTFSFEDIVKSGTLKVLVDGVEVPRTALAVWQSGEVGLTAHGQHTISFVATASAEGDISIRSARWVAADVLYGEAEGEAVAVDLRNGVRAVRDRGDILPFTYSQTNFVGITGATAASIARVSVVELTGAPDVELALWEEKAGTEKVLLERSAEGTVIWRANRGVWKATFEIKNGGTDVQVETAIFDLRKLALGMMFILR